ncbi:hypothetical protein [Paenibacillus amylolyticus]|uniref:hypothetical protein n=1 Tax=Paenibacillus amylolyticus TaxID=1451 RepID=UPI003EBD1EA4
MKKNKRFLVYINIIIFVFAISLAGCSKLQTKINLKGESENWSGELDTTVTNGKEENGNYTILYKNGDWKDIKEYRININEGRLIEQGESLPSNFIKIPIMRTQGAQVSNNNVQSIDIEWTDINGNNLEEKMILKEKLKN